MPFQTIFSSRHSSESCCRRVFLLSARKRFASSATQPIVELREYDVNPGKLASYLQKTIETADLRKSLSPIRSFSFPETGGKLLVATHAYYYEGGHAERDRTRAKMAEDPEWKEYVESIFPFLDHAQSNIFVEAPLVQQHDSVSGLKNVSLLNEGQETDKSILEFRRYQLKLGYDTVPKFLEYYDTGFPSKLSAEGTDPTTALVTVLYSDVGRLNEVIEIWRHGHGTAAMVKSRVAARGAREWRNAIASIAELSIQFTSTLHKPLSFSPLK